MSQLIKLNITNRGANLDPLPGGPASYGFDIADIVSPIKFNAALGKSVFTARTIKDGANNNLNGAKIDYMATDSLVSIQAQSSRLLYLTVTSRRGVVISNEKYVFVAERASESFMPIQAGTRFFYIEDGDPLPVEYTVSETVAQIVAQAAGGQSIGATNGLQLLSNNIGLGGPLTQDTAVTGGATSGQYGLSLGNSGSRLKDFTVDAVNSIRLELAGSGPSFVPFFEIFPNGTMGINQMAPMAALEVKVLNNFYDAFHVSGPADEPFFIVQDNGSIGISYNQTNMLETVHIGPNTAHSGGIMMDASSANINFTNSGAGLIKNTDPAGGWLRFNGSSSIFDVAGLETADLRIGTEGTGTIGKAIYLKAFGNGNFRNGLKYANSAGEPNMELLSDGFGNLIVHTKTTLGGTSNPGTTLDVNTVLGQAHMRLLPVAGLAPANDGEVTYDGTNFKANISGTAGSFLIGTKIHAVGAGASIAQDDYVSVNVNGVAVKLALLV